MLFLAILGILLGIIALPWTRKPIEQFVRRFFDAFLVWKSGELLSPKSSTKLGHVKSIRKGTRSSTIDDFLICEWNHELRINPSGDSCTKIDCLLVNTSGNIKESITFPVYFEHPPQNFTAWAKVAGVTYSNIQPSKWEEKSGTGILQIPFSFPLKEREHVRLQYGYGCPSSFEEGDDWWEWYFGRQHAIFRLKILFDKCWQIKNVRTSAIPSSPTLEQPKIRGNNLYWRLNGPVPGSKYRLDFQLSYI